VVRAVTLRTHPDGYTVICDGCGHSVVVSLSASLRKFPFIALHEVARGGWKGSSDSPAIRAKYGHGVFCPECVGGVAS